MKIKPLLQTTFPHIVLLFACICLYVKFTQSHQNWYNSFKFISHQQIHHNDYIIRSSYFFSSFPHFESWYFIINCLFQTLIYISQSSHQYNQLQTDHNTYPIKFPFFSLIIFTFYIMLFHPELPILGGLLATHSLCTNISFTGK